jgi:hypothetical protein
VANRVTRTAILWAESSIPVERVLPSPIFGGWTLDAHHVVDVDARIIHRGDGTSARAGIDLGSSGHHHRSRRSGDKTPPYSRAAWLPATSCLELPSVFIVEYSFEGWGCVGVVRASRRCWRVSSSPARFADLAEFSSGNGRAGEHDGAPADAPSGDESLPLGASTGDVDARRNGGPERFCGAFLDAALCIDYDDEQVQLADGWDRIERAPDVSSAVLDPTTSRSPPASLRLETDSFPPQAGFYRIHAFARTFRGPNPAKIDLAFDLRANQMGPTPDPATGRSFTDTVPFKLAIRRGATDSSELVFGFREDATELHQLHNGALVASSSFLRRRLQKDRWTSLALAVDFSTRRLTMKVDGEDPFDGPRELHSEILPGEVELRFGIVSGYNANGGSIQVDNLLVRLTPP